MIRRPALARPWVAAAFVAYLVVLAYVVLAPTSSRPSSVVDWLVRLLVSHGAPSTLVTYSGVEFLMNVAMTVPVSVLGAWVVPRWTWRDWTAYGFLAAGAVEAVQALLPGRDASWRDVVANALGLLVGAVLVRRFGLSSRESTRQG